MNDLRTPEQVFAAARETVDRFFAGSQDEQKILQVNLDDEGNDPLVDAIKKAYAPNLIAAVEQIIHSSLENDTERNEEAVYAFNGFFDEMSAAFLIRGIQFGLEAQAFNDLLRQLGENNEDDAVL